MIGEWQLGVCPLVIGRTPFPVHRVTCMRTLAKVHGDGLELSDSLCFIVPAKATSPPEIFVLNLLIDMHGFGLIITTNHQF